jgi:hypothetical protein
MEDKLVTIELERRDSGLPFTFDLAVDDAVRLKDDLAHQLHVVRQRPNRTGTVEDFDPWTGKPVPS